MKAALLKLKGSKKVEVNFKVTVKDFQIDDENDFIEITVEEKNILYEKLTLIKGEIFPLPKINDILKIKEIAIDYDKNLDLRLFIKAKIKFSPNISLNSINEYQKKYSFSSDELIDSLKSICEIKDEIFFGIFKIVDIEDIYYKVICLKNLNKYVISGENIAYHSKGEFLLLSNYTIINKNEIKPIFITIEKN